MWNKGDRTIKALDYFQSISNPILAWIMLSIILAVIFYVSHNWTKETQIFVGGMILVGILMGIKGMKPKITLEEAKIIGLDWARVKKQKEIIDYGTARESIEGITRQRDGKDWYHEVCVTVGERSHYVLGISLFGKIMSTSHRRNWKVTDSPNVEIVSPPDFLSWYKLKKTAEQRMEEESE